MRSAITITIPSHVLERIELDRKDVKRSTYIAKILERGINCRCNEGAAEQQ